MKYLGIDYGEKRIGLSYADELGVAVPLDPARQRRKKDRFRYIGEVIAAREISHLVVGYPINMDGSEGFKAVGMGRRFLGIELKKSYFDAAVNNLKAAESKQIQLFRG